MTKNEWLAKLDESGWLSEVPATEAERIRRDLAGAAPDAPSWHHVLAAGGYDSESIENSGDYRKWVVSAYVDASCGAFKPSKVKDVVNLDKGVATVSVELGDRTFQKQFQQDGDVVADGFHEFMNEVVAATGEQRRFHELPTGDQTAALAFVTPSVYRRAKKLGLVPQESWWKFW